MKFSKFACCFGILFVASLCFAQMYTVTDLGTLGGTQSQALALNEHGQVVGWSLITGGTSVHAFRTAPNTAINSATDDLGTLGGTWSYANAINASGQVTGYSYAISSIDGFRTAANAAIHAATDDISGGSWYYTEAFDINASGQVVGFLISDNFPSHAFRTAPNRPIDLMTDVLDFAVPSRTSVAMGINDIGQVVGYFTTATGQYHVFRTAPNSSINPATDDLGTLGGSISAAGKINSSGQVVGWSLTSGDAFQHAFRTAPNMPINPATDDLGSIDGSSTVGIDVDDFGQVVGGWPAFVYSNGVMHDLNRLVPSGSVFLGNANGINNSGQIIASSYSETSHALLLNPIYKASVQQPINADGSSVFNAKRGVIPVKFAVTQYGTQPSCTLPATIAITRTAGGTLGAIDEGIYSMTADSGSNFRIDGCQYIYNLAASSLGVGTYRVDISMNGVMIGHAVFALK
jgi:probable HAF family extracellular repeat protein